MDSFDDLTEQVMLGDVLMMWTVRMMKINFLVTFMILLRYVAFLEKKTQGSQIYHVLQKKDIFLLFMPPDLVIDLNHWCLMF